MRRGTAMMLALPILLGACHDEPSFDDRYAEAETRINETAAEIDRTLAQQQPAATPTDPATDRPPDPGV